MTLQPLPALQGPGDQYRDEQEPADASSSGQEAPSRLCPIDVAGMLRRAAAQADGLQQQPGVGSLPQDGGQVMTLTAAHLPRSAALVLFKALQDTLTVVCRDLAANMGTSKSQQMPQAAAKRQGHQAGCAPLMWQGCSAGQLHRLMASCSRLHDILAFANGVSHLKASATAVKGIQHSHCVPSGTCRPLRCWPVEPPAAVRAQLHPAQKARQTQMSKCWHGMHRGWAVGRCKELVGLLARRWGLARPLVTTAYAEQCQWQTQVQKMSATQAVQRTHT